MVNSVVFANNDTTTLAAAITSSQTSITLINGASFPSPASGQFFPITFISASNSSVLEIAYCTARSGGTITVTRGQEGTTAQAFNAGDAAVNLLTAGVMDLLPQLPLANTWTATQTFGNGIAVTGTAAVSGLINGGAGISITGTAAVSSAISGASLSVTGEVSSSTIGTSGLISGGANIIATGAINGATGNVTTGARGSGSNSRIVNLGDFTTDLSAYTELPNGVFYQFGVGIANVTVPNTPNGTLCNLAVAFPNSCLGVVANFGGTSPPVQSSMSSQPSSNSQVYIAVASPSVGNYGVTFIAWGH